MDQGIADYLTYIDLRFVIAVTPLVSCVLLLSVIAVQYLLQRRWLKEARKDAEEINLEIDCSRQAGVKIAAGFSSDLDAKRVSSEPTSSPVSGDFIKRSGRGKSMLPDSAASSPIKPR